MDRSQIENLLVIREVGVGFRQMSKKAKANVKVAEQQEKTKWSLESLDANGMNQALSFPRFFDFCIFNLI